MYGSFKEEEEEQRSKYESMRAQRMEVRDSDTVRPRRIDNTGVKERQPFLKSRREDSYGDETKYESQRPDTGPVNFEPEFKHEKRIKKYQKQY